MLEAVHVVRRTSRAERDEQIAKELRNDERATDALGDELTRTSTDEEEDAGE
ncbi:hypothetical protein SAMN05444157_3460 [Frankineae bacterium MT45]|nr:hypothetical protein SAMN05444157_3460 [Frankineae bacterium MT45]